MYEAEKGLNDELAHALDVFKSGQAIPTTMKAVHEAERALRKVEAGAATRKLHIAQRDALVSQLDYLVQLRAGAAGETEGAVVKIARSNVEASLEKDSSLQQKSIDAALKALKEGSSTPADDVVAPLFAKAVEKAKSELAAKPSANPFTSAQQVEMFRKRFGLSDDVVTESALARAKTDKALLHVLTGKVGGKAPTAGTPFVLKAPIAYAK